LIGVEKVLLVSLLDPGPLDLAGYIGIYPFLFQPLKKEPGCRDIVLYSGGLVAFLQVIPVSKYVFPRGLCYAVKGKVFE
jgi:hypothetical protein